MYINEQLIPGHEVVRSLADGPWGSVLVAREAGGSRREVAVKTFHPAPPEDENERLEQQRRAEAFRQVVRLQQELAGTARRWAPVYTLGAVADASGGAFYSTIHYPATAAWLIRNRVKLHAAALRTIVLDVVDGVAELRIARQRSHGNLTPGNVLLTTHDLQTTRAVLSDPLPEPSADPTDDKADDRWAIGALIYGLVTNKQVKRMMLLPLPMDDDWAALGKHGPQWLSLCNRLLAHDAAQRPELAALRAEAARLGGARPGKLAARAGAIAAAVVLCGGAAMAGYVIAYRHGCSHRNAGGAAVAALVQGEADDAALRDAIAADPSLASRLPALLKDAAASGAFAPNPPLFPAPPAFLAAQRLGSTVATIRQSLDAQHWQLLGDLTAQHAQAQSQGLGKLADSLQGILQQAPAADDAQAADHLRQFVVSAAPARDAARQRLAAWQQFSAAAAPLVSSNSSDLQAIGHAMANQAAGRIDLNADVPDTRPTAQACHDLLTYQQVGNSTAGFDGVCDVVHAALADAPASDVVEVDRRLRGLQASLGDAAAQRKAADELAALQAAKQVADQKAAADQQAQAAAAEQTRQAAAQAQLAEQAKTAAAQRDAQVQSLLAQARSDAAAGHDSDSLNHISAILALAPPQGDALALQQQILQRQQAAKDAAAKAAAAMAAAGQQQPKAPEPHTDVAPAQTTIVSPQPPATGTPLASQAALQPLFRPLDAGPSPGSAAVFMGVNQFTDDSSLRSLDYAVDDAIAQAHLFVLDLKLVPAANCCLALSGDPSSDQTRAQLKDLVDAGVQRVGADRREMLRALAKVGTVAEQPSDMLIVSLSSHGFEEGNSAYVLPSDGTRGQLSDTALRLDGIAQRLSTSKATKRLLLVDACQERAATDTRGGDQPMGDAFKAALSQVQGEAVLASCSPGQVSFENPALHHGVFTYYLLQAFSGGALADHRGYLTLGNVSDYVSDSVKQWVLKNKPGVDASAAQSPWYAGQSDGRAITLAVDPTITQKLAAAAKELQLVVNQLKQQIDVDGPFTPELYGKLVPLLKGLDPTDADDVKLLSTIEPFAAGAIPPEVFVPYLQNLLNVPQDKVLARLVRRANSGDAPAMRDLGLWYQRWHGDTRPDLQQGMDWIQKAADAGDTNAMCRLGQMMSQGLGGAKIDASQSLKWYRLAADAGSPVGMCGVGFRYANPTWRERDQAEANRWYAKARPLLETAAAAGDLDAMFALGSLLSVSGDPVQAANWWTRAANAGSDASMVGLGANAIGHDAATALAWFRKAADDGDPSGMRWLGFMCYYGMGMTADSALGMSWSLKAVDGGDTAAMVQIGTWFNSPAAGSPDYVEAVRWYQKAIAAGNGRGMDRLGLLYYSGQGVTQDYAIAMSWFRKSADAGDEAGMDHVGTLYESGHGAPQDNLTAYNWYQRAADAGYGPAMENLCRLTDVGGYAPDPKVAEMWARRGAKVGDAYCIKWLADHGKSAAPASQ